MILFWWIWIVSDRPSLSFSNRTDRASLADKRFHHARIDIAAGQQAHGAPLFYKQARQCIGAKRAGIVELKTQFLLKHFIAHACFKVIYAVPGGLLTEKIEIGNVFAGDEEATLQLMQQFKLGCRFARLSS